MGIIWISGDLFDSFVILRVDFIYFYVLSENWGLSMIKISNGELKAKVSWLWSLGPYLTTVADVWHDLLAYKVLIVRPGL